MKISMASCLGLCLLLCLTSACTPPPPPATALPETRPADFKISFTEGSELEGSLRAKYSVGADSAYYADFSEGARRIWNFQPSATSLDSLYQLIRKLNPLDLKSQVEAGENPGRFGYALEMVYAGKQFAVADVGKQFIALEANYNRFKDILAEVRAFVGKGIAPQRHEAVATVLMEAGAPRPDSLMVKLEEAVLINLQPADRPGDTLTGSFTALRDNYRLVATAQVGRKEWVWSKEILLDKPVAVRLRLGERGFLEMEE